MRLIIFDLDGTLLDSAPDLCATMNYVLEKAGKPTIEYSRCRLLIGNGIQALVKKGMEADGSKITEDELEGWMQIYYDRYMVSMTENSLLYDGALELLQWLREQGYVMALCTNKYLGLTSPLLQHYQIDSYFELVVGGDTLETKKPDPEPVLYCCQELDIDESETLMLGDSINDINAAKMAKVTSVLITHGYRTQSIEELAPDHVIDRLEQLKDRMKQIDLKPNSPVSSIHGT